MDEVENCCCEDDVFGGAVFVTAVFHFLPHGFHFFVLLCVWVHFFVAFPFCRKEKTPAVPCISGNYGGGCMAGASRT